MAGRHRAARLRSTRIIVVGTAFLVCSVSRLSPGSQAWVAAQHRAQQASSTTAVAAAEGGQDASRRGSLLGFALGAAGIGVQPALADFGFNAGGPITMPMSDLRYEEVVCDPDKGEMLKGSRVTYGLQPRCVQVTALVTNPTGKTLERPGVFGRIDDKKAETSVLANALDGATDVGQFTVIETVPPGSNDVKFRFVAAFPKDKSKKKSPLPELEFRSMKVIAYPGGSRFEPISECDMNPSLDGCDEYLEEKYKKLKNAGSATRR